MRSDTRTWTRVSAAGGTTVTATLAYLAELVEPCAHCGIPCSGTVLFWVDEGGVRITVEVDRPAVDELIGALWPVDSYETMPLSFRHHNEGQGWCAVEAAPGGTPYPIEDVQALLALWRHKASSLDRAAAITGAIDELVQVARRLGTPVWIYEA